MVNIERYKIFLTVCETKSFVKAAEQLYVTQAAISKSIKVLESELGGILFIRSNRGLELTPEGTELYNKVKTAMNLLVDAENQFKKYVNLDMGEVRIGISTVLTKILLLEPIRKFNKDYPNVKINVTNGLTSDLLNLMSKNQLDFVIYNNNSIEPSNTEKEILTNLKYAFVYRGDIFDVKNINDITKYPLIAQKNGSFSREFMKSYLKKLNIKVEPSIEVVSQELVRELSKEGIGIGFIYQPLADEILDTIECEADDYIYIATNKANITTATLKFLEYIK